MRQKITGFTLIELIVVIAIIGILAAIAVPRFITQTSNARIAALNGLAGAINSAVSLAQAEYVAEGNSSTTTGVTSITMNGQAVAVVGGTGRPKGSAAGIGTALQTLSGFTATYDTGDATFNFTTTVPTCSLKYSEGDGSVVITSSGC